MNNGIYQTLKTDLASSQEIDAVVRAVQRLGKLMVKELGPDGQPFVEVAAQLQGEVERMRFGAGEFTTLFGGKGPMARRLADASIIDEVLYGKHTAAKELQVAKVLTSFNYLPSQDPAVVYEMHNFCQDLFELLQLGNLQITPYRPYPEMTARTAQTGFYFQDVPTPGAEDTTRAHALVLACTVANTEIKLSLFAGTYHPVSLYVYHPQECDWVQFDGTAVLPGMLEALEQELQSAYSQLNEAYLQRNWPEEFALACTKAQEIMARSAVLPREQRSFVRISEIDRQINIEEAGFKVLFHSVGGDYPNETATIMSQMTDDGKIAFTVSLRDLPVMTQCRLVSVVEHELSQLMSSVVKAEELAQQEALSP